MIFVGKSPYRVSLLGGGSDLDWFVKKENFGVCLGYSLDKYSYSILNVLPATSKKGILEYSTREEYKNSEEIVHPIVREVFKYFNLPNFIELKTFGFASGGSGLGGSASFLLSLISSLSKAFDLAGLSGQTMTGNKAGNSPIYVLSTGVKLQICTTRSGYLGDGSNSVLYVNRILPP